MQLITQRALAHLKGYLAWFESTSAPSENFFQAEIIFQDLAKIIFLSFTHLWLFGERRKKNLFWNHASMKMRNSTIKEVIRSYWERKKERERARERGLCFLTFQTWLNKSVGWANSVSFFLPKNCLEKSHKFSFLRNNIYCLKIERSGCGVTFS